MSVIDEEQARRDKLDAAHWAAVEGPTEVLLEGRLEEGLKQLQAVITADPSNPYAYQFLGAAMFDLKQFGPARDAYRAAVKLSPGYRAARVGLAHCLRLLGDLPEAIEQVSQVLAENDEDADALYALGLTLAAGGQLEQAKVVFERFLNTHPELEAQMEVRGILDALAQSEEGQKIDWQPPDL